MNIDIKIKGDKMTVFLDGEIDHHTSEKIRTAIDSEIVRTSPEEVELDLGGVTFMDSSGIGIIMGRYKKLKSIGAQLIVSSPKPQVRRMIEMSGITTLVKLK